MSKFIVPTHDVVNSTNKNIFERLQKAVGFVPNIYALMAYSETALDTYIKFENAPTSFSKRELEVVKLVVSQENGCHYCLSAHTMFGKMNGLSENEMLEIRGGSASFNNKLDALANLTKEIVSNKGRAMENTIQNFFKAGYTKGSLIDLVQLVAVMVVTNYLNNLTQVPIDFDLAPQLEEQTV